MQEPTNHPVDIFRWPRLRDIPEPDRSLFREWMKGKTVPFVDGVSDEEQDFYYSHDFKNWKSGLRIWD